MNDNPNKITRLQIFIRGFSKDYARSKYGREVLKWLHLNKQKQVWNRKRRNR